MVTLVSKVSAFHFFMNGTLTEPEENLIKDILRAIGKDDDLSWDMSVAVGMERKEFDGLCDSIFNKCQNGRVMVVNDS